jgi:hypothetical protein
MISLESKISTFRRSDRGLEDCTDAIRRAPHDTTVRDNPIGTKPDVPDRTEPRQDRLLRAELIF